MATALMQSSIQICGIRSGTARFVLYLPRSFRQNVCIASCPRVPGQDRLSRSDGRNASYANGTKWPREACRGRMELSEESSRLRDLPQPRHRLVAHTPGGPGNSQQKTDQYRRQGDPRGSTPTRTSSCRRYDSQHKRAERPTGRGSKSLVPGMPGNDVSAMARWMGGARPFRMRRSSIGQRG